MINTLKFLADTTIDGSVNADRAGALAALTVFFMVAIIFVIAIVCAVFWVIALIHLIQNEDVKDRTLWLVLLFIVGGIIGPVYYFAIKKPYDKAKGSKKQK